MSSSKIRFSPVDNETKAAFAKVCKDAGLTPREVLTLFTESVVEQGDIPFHLKAKQLESCMYGETSSQKRIESDTEAENEDIFMAEKENRFFNELMGI